MTLNWSRVNTVLLLMVLLALIGVLARSAYGGPLDPTGTPAPTDSVKLPGTPISSAPFVIAGSGYYYLTRDLSYNGPDAAISFAANVDYATLDLNGFTLAGFNTGTGIKALGPSAPSQFPLMITNGYVRNFAAGVDVSNAAHARIDGVHVFESTGSGFVLGNHDVLSNCTSANNDVHGILISGSLTNVHDCMVVDNGQDGVQVNGFGNVIEDSQILRNGTGIHVLGPGSIVRGNDIAHDLGVSIDLDANSNLIYQNAYCDHIDDGTANYIDVASNFSSCLD